MRPAKIHKKRCAAAGLVLAAGALYYLETQTLGLYIPCLFRAATGLLCPACGITTACVALLRGDAAGAAAANPGLALALPVLAPFLLAVFALWITGRPVRGRWVTVIGTALAVYLVGWGILRNLAAFGFLP